MARGGREDRERDPVAEWLLDLGSVGRNSITQPRYIWFPYPARSRSICAPANSSIVLVFLATCSEWQSTPEELADPHRSCRHDTNMRHLLSEYHIEKMGLDAQQSVCGLIAFRSGWPPQDRFGGAVCEDFSSVWMLTGYQKIIEWTTSSALIPQVSRKLVFWDWEVPFH
jgi:hypothetical protein